MSTRTRVRGVQDPSGGSETRRRRSAVALALGSGAALLALVFTTAASAAVPGLERVARTSEFNSTNVKVNGAPCPVGKRLLGGGGDITGGLGQVEMDRLRPGPFGLTVIAGEDEDGADADWFVRAYSICADPLPGLEIVPATGPSNSNNKHITAACPAGKRLVGVGGEIVGEESRVVLNDLIPNPELTKVIVRAVENQNGTADDWLVRAHAICANPLAGLELATGASAIDSAAAKSGVATCPAGKRVLSAGAEITGALGQVVLDDMTPNTGLTSVTVTGREDQDGTADDWRARAYAICANA
jgi:hypothetical protein